MITHKILDLRREVLADRRTPTLIRLNAADLSELAEFMFRIRNQLVNPVVPVEAILADLKSGNARIYGMRVEFEASAIEPILVCE